MRDADYEVLIRHTSQTIEALGVVLGELFARGPTSAEAMSAALLALVQTPPPGLIDGAVVSEVASDLRRGVEQSLSR